MPRRSNTLPMEIRDPGQTFMPWVQRFTAASPEFFRRIPSNGFTAIRSNAPPSLASPISPAIEQAILKALSIRTEDRFMSMEAFICALNGDVATASAQSPSPGSTANAPQPYSGAVSSRPATFFAVLSAHLKQNPLLAVALGGALVAVVALVLFLPLSGKSGKNTSYTNSASSMNPSSASAPPGSDTPTPSQTPPGQDSDAPDDSSSGDSNDSIGTEVVTYDLRNFKCYHRRSGRV